MKYTKRILSLVLAVVMICAVAVTVSAASYNWMGEYGSSHYEVVDNCGDGKYSSTTLLDTADYTVHSDVDLLEANYVNGNFVSTWVRVSVNGTPALMASVTSGTYNFTLYEMQCRHYVNGDYVHTGYVSP